MAAYWTKYTTVERGVTFTIEQIVAIGVPLVIGLTWLIRLEGRINVGDSRHDDIVNRLTRIEAKLDAGNGHSK